MSMIQREKRADQNRVPRFSIQAHTVPVRFEREQSAPIREKIFSVHFMREPRIA